MIRVRADATLQLISRSAAGGENAAALTSLLTYGGMMVETGNADLGREVVKALRRMGKDAVPALTATLKRAASGRIARMAAAWLLGRVGGSAAERALRAALDVPDGEVATAARRSLQTIGQGPSTEALAVA